jgi:hypothetical protein
MQDKYFVIGRTRLISQDREKGLQRYEVSFLYSLGSGLDITVQNQLNKLWVKCKEISQIFSTCAGTRWPSATQGLCCYIHTTSLTPKHPKIGLPQMVSLDSEVTEEINKSIQLKTVHSVEVRKGWVCDSARISACNPWPSWWKWSQGSGCELRILCGATNDSKKFDITITVNRNDSANITALDRIRSVVNNRDYWMNRYDEFIRGSRWYFAPLVKTVLPLCNDSWMMRSHRLWRTTGGDAEGNKKRTVIFPNIFFFKRSQGMGLTNLPAQNPSETTAASSFLGASQPWNSLE